MLNKLRSFYKTYDIKFDDFYDTNYSEDLGIINIGIFPPNDSDLHHVGDYDKNTDEFDIYHDALMDSLHDFGITP